MMRVIPVYCSRRVPVGDERQGMGVLCAASRRSAGTGLGALSQAAKR